LREQIEERKRSECSLSRCHCGGAAIIHVNRWYNGVVHATETQL
jgi:hypothetical protein